MNIIDRIQIKYFRSILKVRLGDLADVNVFTGGNDIGKSNVLKALNLFFNNEVEWQEELDFYRDFSQRRLRTVRQDTVKGKQFIAVKIWFNRPDSYSNSLPERFAVRRSWDRNSTNFDQRDYLDTAADQGELPTDLTTARQSLSRLLNKIQFEYVPAVRDRSYFDHLLERLQGILLTRGATSDEEIAVSAEQLAQQVDDRIIGLQEEFAEATGIHTELKPPTDVTALFRAFGVSTTTESPRSEGVPLQLRGDGIQGRYVPSVLNYISEGSSKLFIWGFEEPENSLEYGRVSDLADALVGRYSSDAQVFITSHSPAFASLEAENANVFRVFRNDKGVTETVLVEDVEGEPHGQKLREELGLLEIQRQIHGDWVKLEQRLEETTSRAQELQDRLVEHERPVVVVEGKWDQKTLEEAWDSLRDEECPFDIEPADPAGTGGGKGGVGAVKQLLSTRHLGTHPVVGLFDRDKAGLRCFSDLAGYYRKVEGMNGVKKHESEPMYGVLLPFNDETEGYAKRENLPLEFLFPDDALAETTDKGNRLVLRDPQLSLAAEGTELEFDEELVRESVSGDLRYHRSIEDGKHVFHKYVVPNLEDEDFRNFGPLFELLEELVTSEQ